MTRQEIEEVFKDITLILYNSLGKELMNLFSSGKWKELCYRSFLKKRKKGVFTEDKIEVKNMRLMDGSVFRKPKRVKNKACKFLILTRTYERDYSGLVTKINHPGGRYTRYCYDKLGRVIRTDYYDKTYENFLLIIRMAL